MYRWLTPRLTLPLYERLSGRRLWTEARRLRDLQWRSTEEVDASAGRRLRTLLDQAVAHVPYYRALFRAADLTPDDIRSARDLAALPITTKADIRANFPERVVATNLPRHRRMPSETSGSTGLPFAFYEDRATQDTFLGSYLFFLDWAGVALWDLRLEIVTPAHFVLPTPRPVRLQRQLRRALLGDRAIWLSGASDTPATLRTVSEQARRTGRYFIRGLPSYITMLAAALEQAGGGLAATPRAVIGYAETFTDLNKALVRRAFACPVADHYSCREVLHVAQTCPDEPGQFHVNSERALVRIVDEGGADVAPGQRGRVIATNLSNFVMPFINYDTGDWAVAGDSCPCGRGLPTLRKLEGRAVELIRTPAGSHIASSALTHFLASVCEAIPYVWEYQAWQPTVDEVILRVVPTPRLTTSYLEHLRQELAAFLGSGMAVRVELVDRIPCEPSGKRPIVKSAVVEGSDR